MSSGITHSSSATTRIVSTTLNRVDSKFARTQPKAPVMAAGGGCGSIARSRTKCSSATASSPSDIVMTSPWRPHRSTSATRRL